MPKAHFTAAIVYWDTGFGIQRDVEIVESVLKPLGFRVSRIPIRDSRSARERRWTFLKKAWRIGMPFDVQVHLEQVRRELFPLARQNLLIPNPEFFDPHVLKKLKNLHAVCCKTHYACELFSAYPARVRHVGFTSGDRCLPDCPKDYRKALHLAGKSDWKGTMELLEAWRRHPEWPELEVVWSPLDSYGKPRRRLQGAGNIRILHEYLSETELLRLINTCGLHLCLSQTEGFGHYIVEGLSSGAVVVSTDAPPMNELVRPEYGFLAAAEPLGRQFMSTLYRVSPGGIEECLQRFLEEGPAQLEARSRLARQWYLDNDRRFRDGFARLLREITSGHSPRG